MFEDHEDDWAVDQGNPPPWLHLLRPDQKAWRQSQIFKGRNPDAYIEKRLREAGDWPAKPTIPQATP